MWHKQAAYLWDARAAADAIFEFLEGIDHAGFASSPLIQAAVERKFEIIGEALSQLRKIEPVVADRIPEVSRIIAFRNILIHGYAVVDQTRVWAIAHEFLPTLRKAVNDLLEESAASE